MDAANEPSDASLSEIKPTGGLKQRPLGIGQINAQ